MASVYDSNVTGYGSYPFAPEQRTSDPLLESIIAPTTTAMVDFVRGWWGWKTDARYNALSYEVNAQWDRGDNRGRRRVRCRFARRSSGDPKLRVLIAHGWNDLSCPFMGSVRNGRRDACDGRSHACFRARVSGWPHVYSRAASKAALRQDVQAMFAKI